MQKIENKKAARQELHLGPINSPAAYTLQEIFQACSSAPVAQPRQEGVFCSHCPSYSLCSRYFN